TNTIVAPTIAHSGRRLAAGVVAPCAHLTEGEPAFDCHRRQTPDGGAIAELAVVVAVAAPAIGPVGGRLAAAVEVACRHALKAESPGNRPRPEAQVGFAVAELTVSAIPPAEGPVEDRHPAGVEEPGVHLAPVARAGDGGGPDALSPW